MGTPIYDRKRLDKCPSCEWCEDGECAWERTHEGSACVYYHYLEVQYMDYLHGVTDPRD